MNHPNNGFRRVIRARRLADERERIVAELRRELDDVHRHVTILRAVSRPIAESQATYDHAALRASRAADQALAKLAKLEAVLS